MKTDIRMKRNRLLQVLSIPFAWKHPAVDQQRLLDQDWFGSVQPAQSGIFIDYYLLLILGGIPYQVAESNCPCAGRVAICSYR